mgnify:FL=1
MAAKRKKVSKKKDDAKAMHCYGPSKNALVFKGIISILLGLILWFRYLSLTQVFAIVLILVGIKKLYYSSHACC